MTDRLDEALETVRSRQPHAQDALAQAMLDMARLGDTGEIDPDHLEEVLVGLGEIAHGDIATPHEVEAAFHRFET